MTTRLPTPSKDIAIVGMSALFPGSQGLSDYWRTITQNICHIQEAPSDWLGTYFDPTSKDLDRIYARKVGLIGDLAEFNPVEFGILPTSVDGTEPDHFLALKLARDALQDAGYLDRPFNPETAGIILGRGATPNRGTATAMQHGLILDQTVTLLAQLHPELSPELLQEIRQALRSSLPHLPSEAGPGLVSNVASGRIANRLNLMGPNYAIDAACASSLIAVELAIKELLSGRCDLMLAGGVQASMPAQIYMLFCQLGALSAEDIRPFDQASSGTLLSEGCGFLVLKRLETAQQDGDRIYAVIKGVGISSDGKAKGLLTPRLEGEVLAIRRAYAENDIDPATIGLIEAHGTGIPLGDRTEIQALHQCFSSQASDQRNCAIGAVKSLIGHCIPASGMASLIKTALALYHRALPPTRCEQVNPDLQLESTTFYINTQLRPWIHGSTSHPRRAGVNAFGFGGINAHAILEEYTAAQPSKSLYRQWTSELCILSAPDRDSLLDQIQQILNLIQQQPELVLADLAYTLSCQPLANHRLALVVTDLADLQHKLSRSLERLADPTCSRLQTRSGVYYTDSGTIPPTGKTAFLFPGEGSQYVGMLADLCVYFPQVRAWFDRSDEAFHSLWDRLPSQILFPPPTGLTSEESDQLTQQLYRMDVATETVFTASMSLYDLLRSFEIGCDVMVGHSTGEHTALLASGVLRCQAPEQLKTLKRQLNRLSLEMSTSDAIPTGALLTVGAADPKLLQRILTEAGDRLHIAIDNCPNQVVLFGSETDIDQALVQLKAAGSICTRLPFNRGYHTPKFAAMSAAMAPLYESIDYGPGHTELYSCVNGEPFPSDPAAIRQLAQQQWFSTVQFRKTVETLYSRGVRTFIEVGPGSNLTAFVDDTLRGQEYLSIASNHHRKKGIEQLQHLLARLVVNGHHLNLQPLYNQRDLTIVDLEPRPSQTAPVPRLNLAMPLMTLPETIVQKVRAAVTTTPVPPPATVTPSPEISSPMQPASPVLSALSPPVHPPSVTQPPLNSLPSPIQPSPSPEMSRAAIVQGHFELMSAFLANQARIAAAVYTPASSTSAPPDSALRGNSPTN